MKGFLRRECGHGGEPGAALPLWRPLSARAAGKVLARESFASAGDNAHHAAQPRTPESRPHTSWRELFHYFRRRIRARIWRLAWYEPKRRVGVYYPAPLHLVARAAREFAYRLALARQAPTCEQRDFFQLQRAARERRVLAAEYARGYLRGWQECFDAWVEELEIEGGENQMTH